MVQRLSSAFTIPLPGIVNIISFSRPWKNLISKAFKFLEEIVHEKETITSG